MSMRIQEGNDVKYVFSTVSTVTDALNLAVVYGNTEGEVELATDGDTKFAGIIQAIDPGKTDAEDGDNVSVCRDGFIEAKADGDIAFGDALALGTNGTLKALADVDATDVGADDIMLMVGRAEQDAEDGDTFVAFIWVRK